MKKFRRWLIRLLLVLLSLVVGLVLSRDVIFKAVATQRIYDRTGLRTEVGLFQTKLGSATIFVRDLRLYNLPEFGGSLLLHIPKLEVALDPGEAVAGKLHFRKLFLDLAEVHVVRDKEGRNNLEKLEKTIRERLAKKKKHGFRFDFAGIDEMRLNLGKVSFTDLQGFFRSREIALDVNNEVVTGIKTAEDLQTWTGEFLFRLLLQESLKARARTKSHQSRAGGAQEPIGQEE